MERINFIITGAELANDLKIFLEHHEIKFLRFVKCMGYSSKFSFMEFLGAEETKKTLLAFKCTALQGRAISRFIRKYFNYKNNGIMFSLSEGKMSENVLYVAIVNTGKSEKVVDVIRKTAFAGATVLDARGNGIDSEEFFGVEIGSGKEVVLSAIPEKFLAPLKKQIKKEFKEESTDVVSFALPIEHFDKLHQDK